MSERGRGETGFPFDREPARDLSGGQANRVNGRQLLTKWGLFQLAES